MVTKYYAWIGTGKRRRGHPHLKNLTFKTILSDSFMECLIISVLCGSVKREARHWCPVQAPQQ